MWPFWIVVFPSIADIPVTPNGKLHTLDLVNKCKAIVGRNVVAMQSENDIRQTVLQIWKQALPNLEAGSIADLMDKHFLTLGGSSLSVMWCVEKIILETGLRGFSTQIDINQEISITILHKPLQALVDLIVSLHSQTRTNGEDIKKVKEPFHHVVPHSPIQLGAISWYKGRANTAYCFLCSGPVCKKEYLHTKISNGAFGESNISILWKVWLAKCVDSTPLVVGYSNGRVICYVGSHKGIIIAVEDGNVLWSCDVGTRVESSPAICNTGKNLYVGGYDGHLFCIDCSVGKFSWKFRTENQVKSSPYVDKKTDNIWVGSHDAHMHVISSSGFAVGKFATGGAIFSSPIKNEVSDTFYFGSQDGHLYALSLQLDLLWKTNLGAPIFSSPSICFQTGNIICGSCNGYMFAFSPKGEKIWSFQTAKPIYTSPSLPIVQPMVVLFGSHDGFIYCISAESGELKWRFQVLNIENETESMVYSSPAYTFQNVTAGQFTNCIKIAVCNTSGSVYTLKWIIGSNEVEKVGHLQLPKDVFSSPVWISKNQLVVGCRDNFLYSLTTT